MQSLITEKNFGVFALLVIAIAAMVILGATSRDILMIVVGAIAATITGIPTAGSEINQVDQAAIEAAKVQAVKKVDEVKPAEKEVNNG